MQNDAPAGGRRQFAVYIAFSCKLELRLTDRNRLGYAGLQRPSNRQGTDCLVLYADLARNPTIENLEAALGLFVSR